MKGFFVITRTNEMHKHIESFTCLGNEEKHYIFEHRVTGGLPSAQALDEDILKEVRGYSPDICVYVGACSGRMPSADVFRDIKNSVCPTVAFISDAADEPWWSKVREFDQKRAFTVQVALDGGGDWPKADNHISALTPLDPSVFPNPIRPHKDRTAFFGFCGNPGAAHRHIPMGRMPFISQMKTEGLHFRPRSPSNAEPRLDAKTYADAANFMSNVCLMPNFSFTGSYMRHHVKGRAVEAGWAGCLLMELSQSPLKNWFTPGEDFLEFTTMEDAKAILERFKGKPSESQAFGERLRKKVETEHSPQAFWKRIIDKI